MCWEWYLVDDWVGIKLEGVLNKFLFKQIPFKREGKVSGPIYSNALQAAIKFIFNRTDRQTMTILVETKR